MLQLHYIYFPKKIEKQNFSFNAFTIKSLSSEDQIENGIRNMSVICGYPMFNK